MRFNFFEYAFFASAFGTIALFPPALPFLPYLTLPTVALILALAGGAVLLTLALYGKQVAHPTRKRAFACAFVAGCAALFISIAGRSLPPPFICWSIVGFLAIFTFGSILARRFFRHVENDFRRNFGHIIVISLATNAAVLVLTYFFATFPPIIAGIATAAVTLVALL